MLVAGLSITTSTLGDSDNKVNSTDINPTCKIGTDQTSITSTVNPDNSSILANATLLFASLFLNTGVALICTAIFGVCYHSIQKEAEDLGHDSDVQEEAEDLRHNNATQEEAKALGSNLIVTSSAVGMENVEHTHSTNRSANMHPEIGMKNVKENNSANRTAIRYNSRRTQGRGLTLQVHRSLF